MPGAVLIENQEEIIRLSDKFNAIPVFAGIRLYCLSAEENRIPVSGSVNIAEFTGLMAFLTEIRF